MDVTPFVDRLRALASGQFVEIGASADADAAIAASPRTPAVYIVPLAEVPDGPVLIGVRRQRCEQWFGAVLALANPRDATGAAATAELQAKRLAVRAALLGWVPDAQTGEAVTFRHGALLMFRDQRLWWRDAFSVTTYLIPAV